MGIFLTKCRPRKEVSRHIKAMLVVGLETIQEEDKGEGKKMLSLPFKH